LASLPVHAESAADAWPDRPVKLVVSLPPGGALDSLGRHVAAELQKRFKQPFVVENKPGANSFIAAQYVAKAPADGYTMFWSSSSPMTTNAVTFRQLPYDPVGDFAPVALAASFPMAFVVPANSPLKTMADLTALLRQEGGKTHYATGTETYRLAIERYHVEAGVSGTAVPYKGTAPAVMALAGGEVAYSVGEISAVVPMIQGGRLRALAVTGKARQADFPQVPTMMESGFPGYELHAWIGGFFPANTDPAIVKKASDAIVAIVRSPGTQAYIRKLGGEPTPAGAQALREFQDKDIAQMRATAARAKLEPQ
jgi:tripartite-type tricarboxylate transporter receptor subunit TctC